MIISGVNNMTALTIVCVDVAMEEGAVLAMDIGDATCTSNV